MARPDADRSEAADVLAAERTAAFEALSRALGTPPERTVFVDDNRDNIAACAALGFTGLLIDTPTAFAARWRSALPDVPLPEGFDDHE